MIACTISAGKLNIIASGVFYKIPAWFYDIASIAQFERGQNPCMVRVVCSKYVITGNTAKSGEHGGRSPVVRAIRSDYADERFELHLLPAFYFHS